MRLASRESGTLAAVSTPPPSTTRAVAARASRARPPGWRRPRKATTVATSSSAPPAPPPRPDPPDSGVSRSSPDSSSSVTLRVVSSGGAADMALPPTRSPRARPRVGRSEWLDSSTMLPRLPVPKSWSTSGPSQQTTPTPDRDRRPPGRGGQAPDLPAVRDGEDHRSGGPPRGDDPGDAEDGQVLLDGERPHRDGEGPEPPVVAPEGTRPGRCRRSAGSRPRWS